MTTRTGSGLKIRHLAALAVAGLLVAVGIYAYEQENPYELAVAWPNGTAVAAIAWLDGGQVHNEEGHGGRWAKAVAPAHRYALLTVSAMLVPRGPVTCTIKYKGAVVDGPRTHDGVHCQVATVG